MFCAINSIRPRLGTQPCIKGTQSISQWVHLLPLLPSFPLCFAAFSLSLSLFPLLPPFQWRIACGKMISHCSQQANRSIQQQQYYLHCTFLPGILQGDHVPTVLGPHHCALIKLLFDDNYDMNDMSTSQRFCHFKSTT